MRIKVLNSNSDGNCIVLTDNEGKMLLLDVGLPIKKIKSGIDYRVSDLVGALVSHHHADHSKAEPDLKDMGVQVFAPYKRPKLESVKTSCGNFVITAMPMVNSDGIPSHTNADGTPCNCYGFYITHRKQLDWNLVYITDTMYCVYYFKDLKNIIVGTNYQIDRLENVHDTRKYHTLTGHMSIDTVVGLLKADKPLSNVVLSHLSHDNADADLFLASAKEVVNCPVYIARAGLEIEI